MDINEILEQIRRPTGTVPLCLRGDLIAAWEKLERELRVANSTLDDEVTSSGASITAAKIAREMEGLRAEMQAATRVFTFEARRRPDWLQLVKAHRVEGGAADEVNQETFPVAIVAACCIDPAMTPAQAEQLQGELTDGQWEVLGKEVMALNRTSPGVPYSQAAAVQAALHAEA